MHVLSADDQQSPSILHRALAQGAVIVYPTDTTYALGVNALNVDALRSLFRLKGRPAHKPLSITVSNVSMARRYVMFNGLGHALAQRFLPGGLTLVLRHRDTVPSLLVGGGSTLGIRIPDFPLATRLAELLDAPITATSANVAGGPPAFSVADAQHQLSTVSKRVKSIIAVDGGQLRESRVSTVVDCSSGRLKILRAGTIPARTLQRYVAQIEGKKP